MNNCKCKICEIIKIIKLLKEYGPKKAVIEKINKKMGRQVALLQEKVALMKPGDRLSYYED